MNSRFRILPMEKDKSMARNTDSTAATAHRGDEHIARLFQRRAVRQKRSLGPDGADCIWHSRHRRREWKAYQVPISPILSVINKGAKKEEMRWRPGTTSASALASPPSIAL